MHEGSLVIAPGMDRSDRRWPRAVMAVMALLMLVSQASATSSVVQQKMFGLPSGLAYYIEIAVGSELYTSSSAKTFNLLLDTGSSNTAVVTADCCSSTSSTLYSCAASSTCVEKSQTISVSYITGAWSGQLVTDTFSSSDIGVIKDVPFVEIQQEDNFIQSGYDGIVGLAFPSIASPSGSAPKPYFEIMRSEKSLPDVFSTLMCGSLQALLIENMSYSDALYAGELILGGSTGVNGEVYHEGDLVYTPLIQDRWYNALTTAIKVGDEQINVDCKDINTPRTIIDSGTSNIALPSAIYSAVVRNLRAKVQKIIPGVGDAFFSDAVPCCTRYCDPTDKNSSIFELPSITISLALDSGKSSKQQISVTIPPEYIWRPLMLWSTFGVQKCRVFGISEGDLTLLGDVFMDGLFTVHDRANGRLGLGIAKNCPSQVTPTKTITVESLSTGGDSYCDCVSDDDRKSSLISSYLPFSSRPCFFWIWWMYVVLASVAIIVLSLCVVVYVFCQRRKFRKQARQRLARQQSNALDRNLLTPDFAAQVARTPPSNHTESETRTSQSASWFADSTATTRPSSLAVSSTRPSEVHIEMRQLQRAA